MKVIKRNVEQFVVGDDLVLSRQEAIALYTELGSALGLPHIQNKGCNDRYSHGAHWHGASATLYCGGRSFDQT